MANLTPKNLYIGNTQTGNVYTLSSNTGSYAIIKNLNICNTGNATVVSSIHIIPSGGSASSNNKIFSNASILSDETITYDTSIVLDSDSSLYVTSNAGTITLVISGVEYITDTINNN
jgi:hypothetical protein